MASSGWQNEQTVYTLSANWRLVANIAIDSITHSGSNLRVVGTISVGGRGTNGYYAYFNDGIYARATTQGDGAIVSGGTTIYVGGTDYYRGFDVTIGGVSEQTTSFNFSVVVRDGANQYFNTRLYWTLNFDASVVAPSGLTVTHVSNTWNSVTGRVQLSSYGAPSGDSNRYIEFGVVDPTKTTYGSPYRYKIEKTSQDKTFTVTDSDNGTFSIKGCTKYKCGGYATNTQSSIQTLGATLYYTPPAPGQLTYVESSPGTYDIEFTGVAANNQTTYDTASLTRNVRYREVGTSAWTDIAAGTTALITDVTQSTIPVPASKTYEIEAWMTYHGNQSEVSRVTITNTANPVYLYASARGVSKKVAKLYGSVNGQTKKIKKLYGSVGGVSKLIFEDDS